MCTYEPGKGPNDLNKAVSYWQTQMGKIYPEGSTYFAAMMTTLYQDAEPEPTDDNGIIEIFASTVNEGKTSANVLAAEQAWAVQATALKLPLSSWRFNPAWANSPADLVYFVVHDDLKAFAVNSTARLTDPNVADVNAGFADTMTGVSWVKASKIVHRPTMTPAAS
jgi:hypothetical protein